MRILYLNPCGQMGGAETSLLELLRSVRLAVPAWELWLVLGEDGPLAGRARELGVRVQLVPFPRALARAGDVSPRTVTALGRLLMAAVAAVFYTARLAAAVRQICPDVIHTNGLKMHLLGACSRSSRTPVLWHIHDYVGSRRFMGRLLRRFSRRCAAAIANSQSVAADLGTVMPDVRTVVIYNAINLERFAPDGQLMDLDAVCGLPPVRPGTVRVGLVATFARWKGHRVFLQALARLPLEAPVRGYVIGGPIYQTSGSQWTQAELEQEVERLGLTGRVGFTGVLSDPSAAMRSLDIVVHASTQPEPFGMVIVEAMACQRAVIASRAGGAAEIFVDGESALGHAPGDAATLAGQILRLVSDGELRQKLGRAGRSTAERLCRDRRLAAELVALYKDVTGSATEADSAQQLAEGKSRRLRAAVHE